MIISKTVSTKVGSKTFSHFKNLGYNIKNGDIITVQISHLNPGSHTKIEVKCDICSYIKFIKYQDYLANVNKYETYTCSAKCSVHKRELTHLQLYGVSNTSKSNITKQKKKDTTILNYGVENPSKSNIIKQKKKETTLKNFGVDNPLKNIDILNKSYETNLKKYGSIFPSKNQEVKDKTKLTNLKRFGVENPMQNSECFLKQQKSSFKLKEYTLPSGKKVKFQGYENKAIDLLLKSYNENDIIINDKEIKDIIGEIWYIGEDNKKHKYYPDIFIISENKIIEVKSTWTYTLHEKMNLLKKKSCINTGFKFKFMIFNKKGELL
jgi:hypothetical protein